MKTAAQYQTLFAYHAHLNQRLVEGAARLTPADYRAARSYGHASIHGCLFHLLRTSYGWRVGVATGQQPAALQAAAFDTLELVAAGLAEEGRHWLAWLAAQDETTLAGDLRLTRWSGESAVLPLWRILQHVLLHGMQHHSELAERLTELGHSPGNIDFIFFEG